MMLIPDSSSSSIGDTTRDSCSRDRNTGSNIGDFNRSGNIGENINESSLAIFNDDNIVNISISSHIISNDLNKSLSNLVNDSIDDDSIIESDSCF